MSTSRNFHWSPCPWVSSSQLVPFLHHKNPPTSICCAYCRSSCFHCTILENLSCLLQDWMMLALAPGIPFFPVPSEPNACVGCFECIIEGPLLMLSLLLYRNCIPVWIRPFSRSPMGLLLSMGIFPCSWKNKAKVYECLGRRPKCVHRFVISWYWVHCDGSPTAQIASGWDIIQLHISETGKSTVFQSKCLWLLTFYVWSFDLFKKNIINIQDAKACLKYI